MELVGPRGWSCSDAMLIDGETLTIYPPGSPPPSASPFVASNVEAIIASTTSACLGCAIRVGCPLFGDFYPDVSGIACQNVKPSKETTTYISRNTVRFIDPPGVAGDGAPSGGPYQSDGAMTTENLSTNDGVWVDTCTLLMSEQRVCNAALTEFLANYGSRNTASSPPG